MGYRKQKYVKVACNGITAIPVAVLHAPFDFFFQVRYWTILICKDNTRTFKFMSQNHKTGLQSEIFYVYSFFISFDLLLGHCIIFSRFYLQSQIKKLISFFLSFFFFKYKSSVFFT